MIDAAFLIGGLMFLLYGGNILIDSASALAKRFNVPNIVIGLTIIAFGTSAPELATNIFGSIDKNPGLVLGNILGSNIFNILAILGIVAIFHPLKVKSNTTWIEIPLCLLASVAAALVANDVRLDSAAASVITRTDGLMLILFFLIFLGYNLQLIKKNSYEEEFETKDYSTLKSSILIILGFAMLTGGARAFVHGASNIAALLGVSQRIIGLTVVSIGTSLPELITSIISVRKKNVDMALGNVVGSNLFNTFAILGISAVVYPLEVPAGSQIDLLLNIGASFLLFIFIFLRKGRQLDRLEGGIFVIIYMIYFAFLLKPS